VRGEAADWLMRLHEQPDDPALKSALGAWLAADASHVRAWQSIQLVWRVSGELDAPRSMPTSKSFTVLELPRARRARRIFAIALTALAASVALWLGPDLLVRIEADHRTSVAELREVTLDDGSVVTLDAGSAISVRSSPGKREVSLLAGRAFFRVVPAQDRHFVVRVDDVTVTVTGTAFDVLSGSDEVSVAVQSGTVEVGVGARNRPAGTLTGGERLSVARANRQAVRSQVAPEDIASWREHRLVVDGVPLAEVIEELRRHHGGLIVVTDEALKMRRVTGVFDLRRPGEALEAIARSQRGTVSNITPYLLLFSAGS